jgi:hypothetical protein
MARRAVILVLILASALVLSAMAASLSQAEGPYPAGEDLASAGGPGAPGACRAWSRHAKG